MKYLKYLKYIIKHKWFVLIECFRMGLYWRGLTHDLSKLLPSEFLDYAEYFYGNKKKTEFFDLCNKFNTGGCFELVPYGEAVEDKFQIAWLKHQRRNKHHWQYWLLKNDDGEEFSIGMPKKYLKEMLCDWRGAGRAITGKDDTKNWYEKNKINIELRGSDRNWIEEQLNTKTNQ